MNFSHKLNPSYLSFFWPLALLGPTAQAGKLVQNFVLLGYTDGVASLAWYALALGILGPFQSIFGMASQMVTVMGSNHINRQKSLILIMSLSGGLCILLFLMGNTHTGASLIKSLYSIENQGIGVIQTYLSLLSPLLVMLGFRVWTIGLFIRQKRTGWVTILRVVDIIFVILFLMIGKFLNWQPEYVVIYSTLAGEIGTSLLSILYLKKLNKNDESDKIIHSYSDIIKYFWSLAFTTFMFTLSRPIIFAFASRTSITTATNVESLIAALSLAFNTNMIFQITVNQYRNLMTRFGKEDPDGVKQFITIFTFYLTILLFVLQLTPAMEWFLSVCQGAKGNTLEWTLQALWFLLPVPAVIAWRNFYHGLAMVHHHTTTMALAGLARNGTIIVMGLIMSYFSSVDHIFGAMLLMMAFSAEGIVIFKLIRNRI